MRSVLLQGSDSFDNSGQPELGNRHSSDEDLTELSNGYMNGSHHPPAVEKDSSAAMRRLYVAKVLSFSSGASMVAWNKFSTLWLLSIGLTPATTGLLKSAGLVAKTVSQPAWAAIADMKLMGRINPAWAHLSSHWLAILTTIASMVFLEIFHQLAATMPLTILIVARLGWSITNSAGLLVDVMVARLSYKSKEGYGKQRLWGAVAWGGMSLLCGMMIDVGGLEMVFTYTWVARLLLIVCLLWAMREERDGGEAHVHDHGAKKPAHVMGLSEYVSSLRKVVVEKPLLGYVYLSNLVLGFVMVIPEQVLSMQMERDFGMSRTMNGFTATLSIVVSVPCFWFSEGLMASYGHFALILAAHLLTALMCFLNAMMTTPCIACILAISALKGAAFSLNWAASIDFMQHMIRPELVSTCQTLVTWVYYTIAGGLGFVLWSWSYQVHGASRTNLLGMIVALVEFFILRSTLKGWRSLSSMPDIGGDTHSSLVRGLVAGIVRLVIPVGPLRFEQLNESEVV